MSSEPSNENFRCGFVAIVGRPNVGKSTLVNAFLGSKVSIVSPKPQTTRNRLHGIVNRPDAQVILVDTPGFCRETGPLTKALRSTAGSAATDADVTLVVAEIHGDSAEISPADQEVLRMARVGPGKLILAINKIDRLPLKEMLLPWMAAYARDFELTAVVPISARDQDGLDALMDVLLAHLPQGPALFPKDMHTDQAERFICAELVREQLLYQTHDEVPHSAVVVLESFEDGREDPHKPMCWLEGRIYLERDSQKGIVVGKGGQQIKAISQAARSRIEALLGCKVFLKLTVHVDKRWTTSEQALRRYGLMPEVRT